MEVPGIEIRQNLALGLPGYENQQLRVQECTRVRIMLKRISGEYRYYWAKKRTSFQMGTVFFYKVPDQTKKFNKNWKYCAIGRDYQIPLVNGIPTIPQYEDIIPATNLFGEKPNAPGDELAVLLDTQIKTQTTRSIAGKNTISWAVVLIVIGIIIAGIVLYLGVFKPMLEKSSPPPPGSTITVTPTPAGFEPVNPGVK